MEGGERKQKEGRGAVRCGATHRNRRRHGANDMVSETASHRAAQAHAGLPI